jgi:hypothetical protein
MDEESLMNYYWEAYDWSFNRVDTRYPNGKRFESHTLFALRCGVCRKFTIGCGNHLFCGTCKTCLLSLEEEE